MRARDNPFRSRCLDALAFRDPDVDAERLLERWHEAGRRGSVIGPKGSGKTTLLSEASRRLREQGRTVEHLRLSADIADFDEAGDGGQEGIVHSGRPPSWRALGRRLRACGPEGVLILDGIDLLPQARRVALHWQLGRIHGVLVSSHRDGWLPVLHRTRTSPELLEDLVSELLGAPAAHHRPLLDDLFERHRGNLRDALFDLYARAARGGLHS